MKKIGVLLCIFLSAFCLKAQVTYTINSIPYAPDPYNGGTNLMLAIDDMFCGVQPIGFTFNYFGVNYDSVVVSSNGSISFNLSNAGLYANWSLTGITIPDTLSDLKNSIMAPYQDLLATNQQAHIKMDLKGIAPYRRLVVSFDSVSLYSCTSLLFSNQIILYETTNFIDINMENKPLCPTWNNGIALLGIEDSSGTIGYSPANRNGNTQWSTANESWRFIPSNAGPANPNTCSIRGKIFFDGNSNCISDPGEYGNMNRYVLTDVGNYYAYTDINGNYEILVDTGSYIVSHTPYGNVSVLCPPSNSYNVSFSAINDSISNINFGDSTQICSDLYSTAGAWSLRYCKSNFITIPYGNLGSIPETNAVLTVTIPDSTFASNFSITPSSSVWNTYTFNLGTLAPGQMSFLTFRDSVICDTSWLGSTRCFYTSITGSNLECDASNNMDTVCFTVVASYDPNSKEAAVEHLPLGPFLQNGLVNENEWITYKINFQNTGSANAQNIHIVDVLDASSLDTSSVKFVGASHLCTMLQNGNQLNFRLDNINLIDSQHNEPLSHGWVTFKIKSKALLADGTQIVNMAGIFFDNNSVVNTNPNILTVSKPESITTNENGKGINLFPNPMTKFTMLTFPHKMKDALLTVYDIHGQKVLTEAVDGTSCTIKRNNLEAGLYFVQLIDENGNAYSAKLSIQ